MLRLSYLYNLVTEYFAEVPIIYGKIVIIYLKREKKGLLLLIQ